MSPISRATARPLAIAACSLLLLCTAQALGASPHPSTQAGSSSAPSTPPGPSASLQQCVTSVFQAERSATFAGEMTAVPGTVRMSMRVDVQERLPHELAFHAVSAPGLGVWRSSEPKVKVFRYLKQVTNLSSPAVYRAFVRFRWFNAHNFAIKHGERVTHRCVQPASPPTTSAPPTLSAPSTPSTPPA